MPILTSLPWLGLSWVLRSTHQSNFLSACWPKRTVYGMRAWCLVPDGVPRCGCIHVPMHVWYLRGRVFLVTCHAQDRGETGHLRRSSVQDRTAGTVSMNLVLPILQPRSNSMMACFRDAALPYTHIYVCMYMDRWRTPSSCIC